MVMFNSYVSHYQRVAICDNVCLLHVFQTCPTTATSLPNAVPTESASKTESLDLLRSMRAQNCTIRWLLYVIL